MICRWIRDDLTAHADGELRGWRALWVRRHLSHCVACGDEAAGIQASVAGHRNLLQSLAGGDIAADHLFERVKSDLRATRRVDLDLRERSWFPTRRLVLAAAAACVVLGVLYSRSLDPLLMVVGIEDPPKIVVEKPDLFIDYPLFENLDLIENLDNPDAGSEDTGRQRG